MKKPSEDQRGDKHDVRSELIHQQPGRLDIQRPTVPDGILDALARAAPWANTVYFFVEVNYGDVYVGAIGDGANAWYEWFAWRQDSGNLQISHEQYGNKTAALLDGLVIAGAEKSAGRVDMVLHWRDL